MNKEELKNYRKLYYRIWRKNNPETEKEIKRRYRKKHRSERCEYNQQWRKGKYKTDLKFNLNSKISKSVRKSLKGNKAGRHWESLVGYTVKDLKKRLQSTMPEGYNWQDFLQGKLHIDHITAKKYYNFTKYEHIDFKNCWALSNLQLLPAEENLIKGAKLYKPFQPALKMELLSNP